MAVTTATATNPLITTIVTDAEANTTVEIAATSNQLLRAVEISNPNTDTAVYVKILHTASGSSTDTQHNHQLYCPANTSIYYYMPGGLQTNTGIQFYCSTDPGAGASNASAPTEAVTVKIGITDR